MAKMALKQLLQSCQNEGFKGGLMNNVVLEKIHQIYIMKKYGKASVMPSKVWLGLW